MLRGWNVVGGGVVLTVSAKVRSLPWEDAPKMVALVWCSTWSPSARQVTAHGGTTDFGGALLGARCVGEEDDVGVAGQG